TEIVLLITPRIVRNIELPGVGLQEFLSGTESSVGASPIQLGTPSAAPGAQPARPVTPQRPQPPVNPAVPQQPGPPTPSVPPALTAPPLVPTTPRPATPTPSTGG